MSAPGEVRLIGGQWKRTRLPVLSRPGLRPTPDRVRETLFNWLGQDLSGWRVVDAFSGTGALGFEAASRGAREVHLIERDAGCLRQLHALKQRLSAAQVQIHAGDALAWLRRAPPASFDLILLDPPFDAALHASAIAASVPLLQPQGWLYVESAATLIPPASLTPYRALQAGAVHAALWQAAAFNA